MIIVDNMMGTNHDGPAPIRTPVQTDVICLSSSYSGRNAPGNEWNTYAKNKTPVIITKQITFWFPDNFSAVDMVSFKPGVM